MPSSVAQRAPPSGFGPMAATARHMPISEQSVHEVLLSQPRMEMPAAALSSLFAPRDDAERLKLTRAIARICDVTTTTSGDAVYIEGKSRTT